MRTMSWRRFQGSLKVDVEGRALFEDGTFSLFCRFGCVSAQLYVFYVHFGVYIRDLRLKRGRPADSIA